jgi:hypothetical protein
MTIHTLIQQRRESCYSALFQARLPEGKTALGTLRYAQLKPFLVRMNLIRYFYVFF